MIAVVANIKSPQNAPLFGKASFEKVMVIIRARTNEIAHFIQLGEIETARREKLEYMACYYFYSCNTS